MLTNDSPKGAIETIEVLTEIAKGFKLFEKYGLEKLAQDAYALSDAEKAKAKDARDNIAKLESLIAEQKTRQQAIDKSYAENEVKSKQLAEGWQKLGNEAAELKKWESDVKKQSDELRKSKDALLERERAVEVELSKAASEKAAAASARKEAEGILAEIKDRAEKMKGLAQGL